MVGADCGSVTGVFVKVSVPALALFKTPEVSVRPPVPRAALAVAPGPSESVPNTPAFRVTAAE